VRRTRIAVDFDGVVHRYSDGWQGGEIYDVPMEGAAEALRSLSIRHDLILLTARHNLEDVKVWLRMNHLEHYFVDVTNRKPAAIAYLDDRAVRFTDWPKALTDLGT